MSACLRRIVLWLLIAVVFVLAMRLPGGGAVSAAPLSQGTCTQQASTVEELVQARQTAQVGGVETEGLPIAEIRAMLRACWEEYEQQMPAAEEDCARYKELAPRVLGWSRQVSLLGLESEFATEQEQVMPWVTRSLVNCFNEAFDRCVDENDPDQVFEMRRVERQLALLSSEGEIDRGKYDKCLRFEVVFESVLDHVTPAMGASLRVHVRTTVPIQGNYLFELTGGERPLETVALTNQVGPALARAGCANSASSIQPGAPFRVLSLVVDRPEPQDGTTNLPVRDFILSFDRGDTRESYSVDCRATPETPCPNTAGLSTDMARVTCQHLGTAVRITAEGSHYTGFFDYLHEDERAADGFTIRGWTVGGSGAVLARKEYQRSRPYADGIVTRTEKTTFELRHKPQR